VAFYSAQDYQPDDSVGYLMRRILTLFAQGVERELGPTGLTNAQWVPLLKLYRGCASTAAELARECDHDAGSMTRMLDRLEAKNLCQRVRSLEDRRVVNIELTPTGLATAQEIPAILSKVQNDYLSGFTLEEWQTLKGFLRRILETAQTRHASAAPHDTQDQ
jgi:DNA-binding MarR family transcriptional regulator